MSKIEDALAKANRMLSQVHPQRANERPAVAETKLREVVAPPFGDGKDLTHVDLSHLRQRRILGMDGILGGEATEQYRRLRTRLLQMTKPEGQNSIMICSADAGEGKTVTACNLALSIASEIHQTALLVDTDLRKPSVHDYLGIPASPGLSEYLTSDDVTLESILVRPDLPGFSVIPAGKPLPDATEWLASNRMQHLVDEIKQRYPDRYVIFDSPPLTYTVDAAVLAAQVDVIVLVVRSGKTPRDEIAQAIQVLDPAKIAGVVFNGVQDERKRYGYGYGYGQ